MTFKSANRPVLGIARERLRKSLNVLDLFAIGYGDLGSSIYYALGITAVFALGATPIALFLAGIVFICTALTYAEMTSCFHESGGSASFARHAFNDLISFIAGWGLLLDYIVTIAISAFSVAPYLSYFYPDLKQVGFQLGFTIALIVILLIMNIFGIRQSTRISLALAGFTIVTQVVIVVIAGGWLLDVGQIIEHMKIGVAGNDWSPSWPAFWKGTGMAMVAYTGIESIAQLGAEVKKPERTVPRAVIITMFVLVAMYIGLSSVAFSALTPQQLGTTYQQDPIAGIVSKLPFGTALLAPWLGLLAAALLFVAANAGLIGASRLSFNMGEYYQLPRFFYRLNSRFKTPYVSLIIFAILASIIVLASRGQLDFLADLYNFGAMVAFTSAHFSLIAMRIKRPDMKRPFRAPFNISFGKFSLPLTAIIGGLCTTGVWVLVVLTKPYGRYLGIAWMLFGIGLYLNYRRRQKMEAFGSIKIESMPRPKDFPLKIKTILVPTRGGAKSLETVAMACGIAKAYRAKIVILSVLNIPYSLAIDVDMTAREVAIEEYFRQARALASDANVALETKLVRSRGPLDPILEMQKITKADLIIVGNVQQSGGKLIKALMEKAPCRVWLCSAKAEAVIAKKSKLLLKGS